MKTSNGMKKFNQKKVASTVSMMVLVLPLVLSLVGPIVAHGASGLIPCDGSDADKCTFASVMKLANSIIKFLLYSVSVPLAALGFMYAGGKLVLSENKESAWTEAKDRFNDIGLGFLIILGSFVLLKVIIYNFLNTGQGFYTFLVQ